MPEPLRRGDLASIDHTFTAADVEAFARLSGDDNPIHLDNEAARPAGFDREVVHGVLVTATVVVRTIDAVSRDDVDEKTR